MALRFELKEELPAKLAVGGGTVRLIRGWCFNTEGDLKALAITVDGEEHPVEAFGMPRGDVLSRMYPDHDGQGYSFRSGFWGLTPLPGVDSPREVEVGLVATMKSGSRHTERIGTIELVPRDEPPRDAPGPAGKSIGIAMATFDPDPEMFAAQIESIRAQTTDDWICVISDDLSRPEAFETIERTVAGDPRFVLHRGRQRLGFYRNFERALSLLPPDVQFIALSDQDDRWHPDKLELLRGELDADGGRAGRQLVYSDMRVVDSAGSVVADTYWTARPNGTGRLDELLIANTVTGAASLFRRDVLDAALPFPERFEDSYHDQWIAAVAHCLGEVHFIERPLHDYVQHDAQVLGHKEDELQIGGRGRFDRWRRNRPQGVGPRVRARMAMFRWERIYFEQLERMSVGARTLRMRFAGRLTPEREKQLARIAALDSAGSALWAAGHRARRPARRSPTMGNESNLLKAMLWRRFAALRRRLPMPRSTSKSEAVSAAAAKVNAVELIDVIGDKLVPLNLGVSDAEPARVNVLIPYVDLDHFFAGYIGMFNLARRLAERGSRARIVSVETPKAPLPSDWRDRISRYDGLADINGLVEFASAADRSTRLPVNPGDTFIAMSCWSAQLAHQAAQQIGNRRFLFAVQEYEPFFHPMGSLSALTASSYELPHTALFSSKTLREYFRREGIGVYGEGDAEGERLSTYFENAMTELDDPDLGEMEAAGKRLLFYARPEPHAARNMYELGHMALADLIGEGVIGEEWELYGIGSASSGSIELAEGRSLRLIPRLGQDEYAQVLRDCSVGLSLMLTPHPSLVPLEMASAGLVTVTNSFATKTPERIAELSDNLIAAHPTVAGVKAALAEAIARSEDYEARLRGAKVNWAQNWSEALPDELLGEVERLLGDS